MPARKPMMPRLLLLPLALIAAPAFAQEAAPCPEKPALAEPWTSWTQNRNDIAGHDAAGATALRLGQPLTATLHPIAQLQFAAAPGKPSDPKSYGGTFRVDLVKPARVGIGLSGPAWVDAVRGTQALSSVDHGHGPDCSGLRKIVWFDLPEGATLIQIAGAPSGTIRIMAADAAANQPVKSGD